MVKRAILFTLALFYAVVLVGSVPDFSEPKALQGDNSVEFKENEAIVKLYSNAIVFPEGERIAQASEIIVTDGELSAVLEQLGFTKAKKLYYFLDEIPPELDNTYTLYFQPVKVGDAIEVLNEVGVVEYAEPNYAVEVLWDTGKRELNDQMPDDEFFSQQWALHNTGQNNGLEDADVDALEAWSVEKGEERVVIAIVDSGVDYNHEDLSDNILRDEAGSVIGYDFANNEPNPMDDFGHGTHVAGIAAAVTDNGMGVAGACQKCKIMPVKFISAQGFGGADDAADSIAFAVDNGADVVSNSWAIGSQAIEDAVKYAFENNVVIVASAGNGRTKDKEYPAAYDEVIAVSNTDNQDRRYWSSSYGSWVDVGAPGVQLLSTVLRGSCDLCDPSGYKELTGTSMSAPLVAGVIGLIKSRAPHFTNEEIFSIIHTAVDSHRSGEYIGTGRLNARKAVEIDAIPVGLLDSVLDEAVVNNVIQVTGSAYVENHPPFEREVTGVPIVDGFKNYALSKYSLSVGKGVAGGANAPGSWTTVCEVTSEVKKGLLCEFDSSSFEDGEYSLKLIVEDNAGHVSQDFSVLQFNNIEVTQPRYLDLYRPGEVIEIKGSVMPQDLEYYAIEYGQGLSPTQWKSDGITLTNQGINPINNGVLATWDTTSITATDYYKLRLGFKTRSNPNMLYEYRPIVYFDSSIKQGWPVRLEYEKTDFETPISPGSLEPVIDDLDNDGQREIILFKHGSPNKLLVYDSKARLKWSFDDLSDYLHSLTSERVSISDLNYDGFKEILVFKNAENDGETGELIALNYDGIVLWRAPGFNSAPSDTGILSADLDLKDDREIVVTEAYPNYKLTILDSNGEVINSWIDENTVAYSFSNAPAVGNFDEDAELEIVSISSTVIGVPSKSRLYVHNLDGSLARGWPRELDGLARSTPAVGDVNNDGRQEIVVSTSPLLAKSDFAKTYVFTRFGGVINGWPKNFVNYVLPSPTLSDVDSDGSLEITALEQLDENPTNVYLMDYTGEVLPAWPKSIQGHYSPVISADADNDGIQDLLMASTSSNRDLNKIHAWNAEGAEILGAQKFIGGALGNLASPSVFDIDDDGKLELVLSVSREYDWEKKADKNRASIYAWELDALARGKQAWPTSQHDAQHTGNYCGEDADCTIDIQTRQAQKK